MLSLKISILLIFIASAAYIHFRGKVRFKPWRQLLDHSSLMAPVNVLLYAFSKVPNKPYLPLEDFPELNILQKEWETIRAEGEVLFGLGHIKSSDQYDDIGFNSFFKQGWKRFYLKWYEGCTPSAEKLCPKTVALLKQIPNVKGAMFVILSKGGRLVRHRDPFAGSLRYHLGLRTPNAESCRLIVDGEPYVWRDGEAVLFDETYIHTAENLSDQDRLILFCDVERPVSNPIVAAINRGFGAFVMAASQTQNLPGDPVGGLNKAFKYLYKIRLAGKAIKRFNKTFYYVLKYTLVAGLFYWIFC